MIVSLFFYNAVILLPGLGGGKYTEGYSLFLIAIRHYSLADASIILYSNTAVSTCGSFLLLLLFLCVVESCTRTSTFVRIYTQYPRKHYKGEVGDIILKCGILLTPAITEFLFDLCAWLRTTGTLPPTLYLLPPLSIDV